MLRMRLRSLMLCVSLTRSPWLLLAPLLSPTVPQVTSPPCCLCPEGVHRFQWIRNLVPEFGVSSSHVRVLSAPTEFFELMKVSGIEGRAGRAGQSVVAVWVGASGVRWAHPGWGHLQPWKLLMAAQLTPVGSACWVPASQMGESAVVRAPWGLRWSSPDGGSEGRCWRRACGQPAPLSCA